jgi:hypothetical protein
VNSIATISRIAIRRDQCVLGDLALFALAKASIVTCALT